MEDNILQRLKNGVKTRSAGETASVAAEFSRVLKADDFVLLSGNLGCGKTAFAKGLARGLGVLETVKSPSFNVCSIYATAGGLNFVHIDAYRLSGGGDFENLLLDEIVSGAKIVCVEWPEAVADALPKDSYKIEISALGEIRNIKLS